MLYMYHVQYICISYIPILFIVAFVLHTTDRMNIGSHAYSLVIWGHCYFISSALELDILINITSLRNHEIVKVPMYNYGLRFRALPFAIGILFAYRIPVHVLNKVASQAHLSLWHFLFNFGHSNSLTGHGEALLVWILSTLPSSVMALVD